MKTAPAIIIALLIVAGCRMEQQPKQPMSDAKAGSLMATATAKIDSSRAIIVAEKVQAIAKVASVMQANDITLPQVAAYLDAYGFDVINRSEFRQWTWAPAPAGTYPIAYYIANFRVATGTNSLRVYLPQTAGPYWIRVKAYDGHGNSGPWSVTNTSGPGELLPGVVGE